MTAPATSDDPRAAATYRATKAVVIILGVLIVIALIALVVGVGFKLAGRHGGRGAEAATATLPPGAKITAIETSGNRLILGLHTGEGDEVDIVDTDSGHLVARIKAPPPEIPR